MATIITAIPLQLRPRRYHVALCFFVATRMFVCVCECVHDVFSVWMFVTSTGVLNEWVKTARMANVFS